MISYSLYTVIEDGSKILVASDPNLAVLQGIIDADISEPGPIYSIEMKTDFGSSVIF